MEITAALIMIFIAICVPILLAIVIGFTAIILTKPNSVSITLWGSDWGHSVKLTTNPGNRIAKVSLNYNKQKKYHECVEVVIVRWVIRKWWIHRIVTTCKVNLDSNLKIVSCEGCIKDHGIVEILSGEYRFTYDPKISEDMYVLKEEHII